MAAPKSFDGLLNGQYRFGRLTVITEAAPRTSKKGTAKHRYALCRCDCGTQLELNVSNIKRGLTKSCGCYRREFSATVNLKHGRRHSVEYETWKRIIQRTENPSNPSYPDYGGRGIKVCPRWRNSFNAFFEDMGPRPSSRHSIDRVNNDGDYEPSNCCWALPVEQARNRRANRIVTYDGREMTMTEALEISGLLPSGVYRRIARGWPEERWFEPSRQRRSNLKRPNKNPPENLSE